MSTTYTEHYNFGKQENYADLFSMKVITDNWDSLDTILYEFANSKQDKLSATNKLSVAFVDFTPEQIAALDSGITSEDVEQIETNKTNIYSNTLNGGGINKFQVTATTTTINGITFTVNADKTITATGAIVDNTQNAIFTMGAYTAVSGDVLSEGFAEANAKAYVYARGGSTSLATAPYREILSGDIGVQRNYACVITNGMVGQINITFKPMVCTSDSYAKSGVYQPYAMSNIELTQVTQQSRMTRTSLTQDTYVLISDLAVTLPAGKTITMTVGGQWGNGFTKEISIITGNTINDSNTIGKAVTTTGLKTLSCNTVYRNTDSSDVTINVAVMQSATGNNNIFQSYTIT